MANEPKDKQETTPSTETTTPAAEGAKYLTPEDFNKAVTAREKRFEEKLLGRVETTIAKLIPATVSPAEAEEPEGEEEEKKPEPKAATPAPADLATKKLQAKMKEFERSMKKEKEEAAKQLEEMRVREERSLVTAALNSAGVTSVKHAMAVLKEDGRVRRNKDGELIFVALRDIGGEKYDEELSLEQGIKEWLDSPDGKFYQPPKGVEGSGATSAKGARRSVKGMNKDERKIAAGQTLLNWALRR